MVLEEPAAIALAELEAAEDEPMGPEDAPPEPPPSEGGQKIEKEGGKTKTEDDPSSLPASWSSHPPVRSSSQGEKSWSPTDLGVVIAALLLLGLSLAGLFWLLHT